MGMSEHSEGLGKTGLSQDRIRSVSAQYGVRNNEMCLRNRAVPDFVAALAMADKDASGIGEDSLEVFLVSLDHLFGGDEWHRFGHDAKASRVVAIQDRDFRADFADQSVKALQSRRFGCNGKSIADTDPNASLTVPRRHDIEDRFGHRFFPVSSLHEMYTTTAWYDSTFGDVQARGLA